MAQTFTVDDLKEFMRACAGVSEGVDLDGDIAERPFDELGYDSLAVLEIAAKLQNHLGVPIPEDVAADLATPRAMADYVSVRLAAA